MKPDPIPIESRCRILDAAIRVPNGGNVQRRHFLAVDGPGLKAGSPRSTRPAGGRSTPTSRPAGSVRHRTRTPRHFTEIPLLLFVFAVDDHGGAGICPAIRSSLPAARRGHRRSADRGAALRGRHRLRAAGRAHRGRPADDRDAGLRVSAGPLGGRCRPASGPRGLVAQPVGRAVRARVREPLWLPDTGGPRIELDVTAS
ncbi:hypothetical protein [Actinacidiphila sp. bgisy160]|uniref:hypothetical protein n=1 Tax=Actinacidiphila sp. bgisy160 TaxID=3413796 RepID=UPI003D71D639